MGWQYATALGNSASALALYVENLAKFSNVEIQFSVDDTPVDRRGNQFTPTGEPVGDFLRRQQVDVHHYVCPYYNHDAEHIGVPAAEKQGFGKDPFALFLKIAQAADKYGWWLQCEDGGRRPTGLQWHGEPMYPLDIANPAYRDWFVETVTRNRGARRTLRFDCGWTGDSYEVYIKCPICDRHPCHFSRTAEELTEGQKSLYDALRREGWRVIVNASWEMSNPHEPPANWHYPLMQHLDGVMMEVGEAVYVHSPIQSGGDGKMHWIRDTPQRRKAIAKAWLDAGKVFVYAGRWSEKTGFDNYDDWRKSIRKEAEEIGYRAALNRYGVTEWHPDYQDEKPSPLFAGLQPPQPVDKRAAIVNAAVDAHCLRVNPQAALMKRAWADGYQVSGNEVYPVIDGVRYACVYADSRTQVHSPRVYFVPSEQAGDPDAIGYYELTEEEQAQ